MTREEIKQHLDAWLAADLALAQAKSYTIVTPSGSRSLTRADGEEIKRNIDYWNAQWLKSDRVQRGLFSRASFIE